MKNSKQITDNRQQKTGIRNRHLNISIVMGVFVYYLLSIIYHLPVNAQIDFCSLFPCNENINDVTASSTLSLGMRVALFGVGMIFTVFIAAGIFYIVKAVLKIIRSEGDPAAIEGGVKIIKGVYAGILILIVGIVGLIIILGILQSGRITGTDIPEPGGITLPEIQ